MINWKLIGDIAFYTCTFITVLYSVFYFLLAPWWKTVTGRNVMVVWGTMGLAFSYFSWAIALGGVPEGFDAMRAVLFCLLAASIGWRTVIFTRQHLIRSLRGESKDELENAR